MPALLTYITYLSIISLTKVIFYDVILILIIKMNFLMYKTLLKKSFIIAKTFLDLSRKVFLDFSTFTPRHISPLWKQLAKYPDVRKSSFYLTIFIRHVTLNTELDTVYLFVWHGQRTHFGVYPLVCPFSTWPGQGFYVELFLIGALNRLQRWQRSRAFLAQTSTYKGNVLCFFAEK